jgi:hypothetical protein
MVGVCAAANSYRHGFVILAPAGGAISNFTFTDNYSYNVDLALDIQATYNNNSGGTISNNILIGKGLGETEQGTGLFLGADNASYSNAAINIYNNVIGSDDASGNALFVGRYNNSNITLKNNIIYHSAGGNVCSINADLAAYLTTVYNIWYSSGATPFYDKGTARNFAGWKTSSSQDAHSINADPLFVSAASGNFNLQPLSPAIDKGVAVQLYGVGPTVYWAAPDIGSYEFRKIIPVTKPKKIIFDTPEPPCASTNAACYVQE